MALRALNWLGSNWSWYRARNSASKHVMTRARGPRALIGCGLAMRVAGSMPMSFDRSPAQLEAAHQGIDALAGQCLGLTGQVGVAVGGENGVECSFDEMCCTIRPPELTT